MWAKDGIEIKLLSNQKKENSERKFMSKKRKIIIRSFLIIGILIILLVLGFTGMGVYVQSVDTVFPNVSAAGLDVGGMRYESVLETLNNAGYTSDYTGMIVTVNFPGNVSYTVTAEDAGLVVSNEDAAQFVLDYGKDGSFFGNTITYLRSMAKNVDVLADESVQINEENVRSLISKMTEELYAGVLQNAYVIEDDQIVVIKGYESIVIDEDEVYQMIKDAFITGETTTINYEPQSEDTSTIDLQAIYDAIYVEPVNAEYDEVTQSVSQSVVGVGFDISAAQALFDNAKNGETIIIPIVITEPEITYEALSDMIFRDVLSEKRTSLSGSSSNRINNITLAAAAINGTVLNPGDTFSYNGVVGQRTTAKGYKEAGAYVGGRTVLEVGGGICQVSSTIYYCVLHADLAVTDRSNHMFSVGYLPLGLDATVNWGTVDFKFTNDSEYPVKIVSYVSGSHLTVQLLGTKLDENYVEMKYVVISTTPYVVVEQEDETIPEGESQVDTPGHTGYVVDTYKYIYDGDGNLLSKTFVARNTYRKQDRVILVPVTVSPSPSDSPSPTATATPSPTATATPSPTATATPSPTVTTTP